MAEIVKITKDGVIQYPITKPEAVIDENGKNVLQLIRENGGYDDTGIKKDISDLKEKDTEHDEELAGLSKRVGNMEEDKPVFKAIYGETTYDEIKAAYDSGKVVHCDYNSYCYVLVSINATSAYFEAVRGTSSYMIYCNSDTNAWYGVNYYLEQSTNRTISITDKSTDTQYPSAKAVFTAIGKKSEVSLETLANGNLKVTIDGVSKDFMPATPSGDPMHYMFEAVGATYNATDADIPMVGIYGDSYVHKAKHWHLNELGDITNEEIRAIYSERYPFKGNNFLNNLYKTSTQRTFICNAAIGDSGHTENYFMANSKNLKTVRYEGSLTFVLLTSLINYAYDCSSLQKILSPISLQYATSSSVFLNAFGRCQSLEYVQLFKLSQSISFKDSPLLSKSSILFMIQKEAATAAITITLHADAYDRAMADADIQAALAAHPNVSLAK